MTAFMLATPSRCFVVIDVSGFPPNDRLNFSMLAKKDDQVWKFLDDQYRDDIPVDQNGNLATFVMADVWVEPDPRDPLAAITVCPIAYSPRYDLYASGDCLLLQPTCNPN